MLPVFALLIVLSSCAALKDLGYEDFACDADLMRRSKPVPKNVHSLRFADIDIIAGIGDSITAANGAGADPNDPIAVLIQYRGLAFSMGGDGNLEKHVTLTNILKKFNPDIFGYSTGTGSANVWQTARLNAAVPGAVSGDLIGQANDLVRRMKEHPDIDFITQWKLVHIFIGGNDLCAWCDHQDTEAPEQFRDNIRAAVQILQENLPRTIVVLTGILDFSLLRRVDVNSRFCKALHTDECPCEMSSKVSDEALRNASLSYMQREQELEDSGEFDTVDDFTLVVQPFFEDISDAPRLPNGDPDLSLFAPDCFHFSQYGHAMVAKNLWNNMNEPVGSKSRVADLTNTEFPLKCPDAVGLPLHSNNQEQQRLHSFQDKLT
ncbi:hypothetical protein PRIPAC_90434 [Pristionchus pacificus]|uniref:Lipase n=1 Tax=Pristionchus pacificus TaxID=54126 RepID=A0A2A6CVN8_PRIPA|nr:hypothetical protein PRIPAC_90434 [Pristionchus pacificus]|eukprot:PDM82188.1 lipase [Pristionchus pacificus]